MLNVQRRERKKTGKTNFRNKNIFIIIILEVLLYNLYNKVFVRASERVLNNFFFNFNFFFIRGRNEREIIASAREK